MSTRLFKFKNGDDASINDLLENRLSLPLFSSLNDPLELNFYIDSDKDATEKEITDFQDCLYRGFNCLSLSTASECKRLWNYYTSSMKGYVVGYYNTSIEQALQENGFSSVNYVWNPETAEELFSDPEFVYGDQKNIVFKGRVQYYNKIDKINLTKTYDAFATKTGPSDMIDVKYFFSKDASWSEEYEYRYVFQKSTLQPVFVPNKSPLKEPCAGFLNQNCDQCEERLPATTPMSKERFYLNMGDHKPFAIYLGYRMPKQLQCKIKDYCIKKKIRLFCYTPNFHSPHSRAQFVKTILFDPGQPSVFL